MSRPFQNAVAFVLIALTLCTGCHPTQPFFASKDSDLSHYMDKATQMEYPDVDTTSLADAKESKAPLTVSNPEFTEIWDVSLQECVNIALQNTKVIRSLQAVVAVPPFNDALIGRTQAAPTVYDPALQASQGLATLPWVGSRNSSDYLNQISSAGAIGGVEGALAEFDASLRVSGETAQTNRPQFNRTQPFSVSELSALSLADAYSDSVRADIAKKTATGAVFTLSNVNARDTYNGSINPSTTTARTYWTTSLEASVNQPLLRGRGTQLNRIPIVLARINEDITLSQFEGAVRNFMMDLETAYWDLHLAYRNLETAKVSRDSAQIAWRIARGKNPGPGSAAEEAQATEQYFNFRGMVETSLRELYTKENQLRFLLGLAATDGRLMRPIDEPTMARVTFDWCAISAESLVRSPELRNQKWNIKQRELELVAAKNLLLPKFDASASYRQIGVGNEWNSGESSPLFPAPGSGSLQNMGKWHEASVQFEFYAPIGFRRELARVRLQQLQMARDKARLEDMELNLTHMLTQSVRNMDTAFVLVQTHFNRWSAAEAELNSLRAQYEGGKITLYELLDSQRRRAQAQNDFYKAVTDHSKAIAEVHFRKGSLLEFNNVSLAEGPWPKKAYWDAVERARERDASYYLDYGFTRPNVVSLGPAPQGLPVSGAPMSSIVPGQPTPAEGLPVPSEAPADGAPGQPATGDDSQPNSPEPMELGPVTGAPSGPALNAPATRTADSDVARALRQSQKTSFDWSTLELDGKPGPTAARSEIVPAGYSAEIGDRR